MVYSSIYTFMYLFNHIHYDRSITFLKSKFMKILEWYIQVHKLICIYLIICIKDCMRICVSINIYIFVYSFASVCYNQIHVLKYVYILPVRHRNIESSYTYIYSYISICTYIFIYTYTFITCRVSKY
jgi:hypothetical protein